MTSGFSTGDVTSQRSASLVGPYAGGTINIDRCYYKGSISGIKTSGCIGLDLLHHLIVVKRN